MSADDQIREFVRELRRQIHVAEDAGAEHDDLCIVLPVSYLTTADGWPEVEILGSPETGQLDRRVAVVPKVWARNLADRVVGESSFSPPPPSPSSAGGGLWGFSSGSDVGRGTLF